MAKVVITGAGGYIGSRLIQEFLLNGDEVLAVDRLFFGENVLAEFKNRSNFKLLKKDIRDLTEKDLVGYDVVCDLACLSNDPSGEINQELTYQINRDGRIHVAKIAKAAGIKRYILSSSCSVYGNGADHILSESSKTNPISVYSKSTLQAEESILELSDSNFSTTALRNATVFGLSKRMRFDLVINLMTLSAFQKSKIIVMGGGLQWRPLVHVSDVALAFLNVANTKEDLISGQIFNVGLDNFQIKNLALKVKETLKLPIEIDIAPDDADKRDYNVEFFKASKVLNFSAKTTVEQGINEIFIALNKGVVDTGIKTVTVKWYKHILDAKEVLDSVSLNGRII
jgi:nucleoside-diphosphate-sugar epimerase